MVCSKNKMELILIHFGNVVALYINLLLSSYHRAVGDVAIY